MHVMCLMPTRSHAGWRGLAATPKHHGFCVLKRAFVTSSDFFCSFWNELLAIHVESLVSVGSHWDHTVLKFYSLVLFSHNFQNSNLINCFCFIGCARSQAPLLDTGRGSRDFRAESCSAPSQWFESPREVRSFSEGHLFFDILYRPWFSLLFFLQDI